MAIDFGTLLTDEQRVEILSSKIQQFAAEGYQHTLNRKVLEDAGNEQGVAEIDNAIQMLNVLIASYQEELASLTK